MYTRVRVEYDKRKEAASKKYCDRPPLTEAMIKVLLKNYYGSSFIILSADYMFKERIFKKELRFLPVDVLSQECAYVIFPFHRTGKPIDMNELLEICKKWQNELDLKYILVGEKEGNTYFLDRDNNISDSFTSKECGNICRLISIYLKKMYKKDVFEFRAIHQPGSIMFDAYPTYLKGEFCMPIDAWYSYYGSLYN